MGGLTSLIGSHNQFGYTFSGPITLGGLTLSVEIATVGTKLGPTALAIIGRGYYS